VDSKCITSYGSIGDQESLLGASFGFIPHYLVLDQTRRFSFFVLQSLHGKTTPHSPKPVFLHRLGHALEGFLIKIAIFKHSRRHDDVKGTIIFWFKTKLTLSKDKIIFFVFAYIFFFDSSDFFNTGLNGSNDSNGVLFLYVCAVPRTSPLLTEQSPVLFAAF